MDESKFNDTVPEATVVKYTTNLFPIQVFPEFFQDLFLELEKSFSLPIDYFATAFLSAIAAAIGNKVRLCNRNKPIKNMPVFWIALVGPTGAGKTPPMDWFFDFLIKKDVSAHKAWKDEIKEIEKTENEKKEPPPRRRRIISRITQEARDQLLSEGNSLTMKLNELLSFTNDFGRYSKGRSGEEYSLLGSWDTGYLFVDTKHEGSTVTENTFLGIIGGVQTQLLNRFLTEDRLISGFAQRFLYVLPPIFPKRRYSYDNFNKDLQIKYEEFIEKILRELGEMAEPIIVWYSGKREVLYGNFFDKNHELIENEPSYFLKGWYSKLDIHYLRLALVLHVIYCLYEGTKIQPEISEEAFKGAEILCEYFRENAKRINEIIEADPQELKNEDKILIYLKKGNLNDNEIALKLGVTRQFVGKVRNKHGIPPKDKRGGENYQSQKNCMDL